MSASLLAEALRALVPFAEQARRDGDAASRWKRQAADVLKKAAPCRRCGGHGEVTLNDKERRPCPPTFDLARGDGGCCGAGWTRASLEEALALAAERERHDEAFIAAADRWCKTDGDTVEEADATIDLMEVHLERVVALKGREAPRAPQDIIDEWRAWFRAVHGGSDGPAASQEAWTCPCPTWLRCTCPSGAPGQPCVNADEGRCPGECWHKSMASGLMVELGVCIGADCIREHGVRIATWHGTGPCSIYVVCDECYETRLTPEERTHMTEMAGAARIRGIGLNALHHGRFLDGVTPKDEAKFRKLLGNALRALVPVAMACGASTLSSACSAGASASKALRQIAPCTTCSGQAEVGGSACGGCSGEGWTPASLDAVIAGLR